MASSSGIPIKKKIFLSHFIAILFVSGSIGTFFYISASKNLMNSVRSRLSSSAALIGQSMDAGEFDAIQSEADATRPAYLATLSKLRALKRTNQDVAFLYVMRRKASGVEFVVDTDETDAQAMPGTVYPDTPDELIDGFDSPSVDQEIYSDEWGSFLSGYAPVLNGEGKYLVGIDMRADEVAEKLRMLRLSGGISFFCSLLLAWIFSRFLGGSLVRRIELLTMQCRAIAQGGVSDALDYGKGDELETLIHAFNRMSEKLAESKEETDRSKDALEASYHQMEQKVAERTRDLSALNDQLAREVRERKLAEEAELKRNEELQQALSQVKALNGLLPICASCKKIRDDQGYWNQIETYIREHSQAEFSHSICPECARQLYNIDLK